jgi:photosystem II stability/assembly factor-like uncharacterized protein
MKKIIIGVVALTACILLGISFLSNTITPPTQINDIQTIKLDHSEDTFSREATQQGRAEYFFKMLRDPSINQIPKNIFSKERQFLESLNTKRKGVNDPFEWKEVGPNDIGGRTRAVALDPRNPDIILAGGVSGGLWKSNDSGQTWTKKTDISSHLGVSALTQNPLNQDEWFYSTGEIRGNSARASGAPFRGSGIFTSTDNGETWNQIESTKDDDIFYNSPYDYISNLTFSPTTGTSFFGSNGFGIYRSTNAFESSHRVLGKTNQQVWADVAVTKEGVVIAALSSAFSGVTQTQPPGVYISRDDGLNWTNITPTSFPTEPNRSVIGTSESDPNIFFVFTDVGAGTLSLHKFDISDPNSIITSDRSSGIPNFGSPAGQLSTQGSYNMVCKIHPTDPNIVFIGGTNLYRSTDGFSSIPSRDSLGITPTTEASKYWIGGYRNDNITYYLYPNHHPDNHNLIFDPTNPNITISAHDGGLSKTEDITAEPVVWSDIDEGYNVTQFYKISIHPEAEDARIMGGTQDNGSPYFSFDFEGSSSSSFDVSSGDGATNYIGYNYLISSSQNGRLLKWNNNFTQLSYIKPSGSENQQFIHPFAVNPSDENYLFYPEFDHFWRNDQVISITSNSGGGTQGWTELDAINTGSTSHEISALTFSKTNPSNVLYFGGYSSNSEPTIRRLDDLDASDGEVDISIPTVNLGSYVNDLTVNPDDGEEVLAIMSNYNVKSIWHSNDAGNSWSDIEGNLGGENGPSIRSAAIVATTEHGTYYFVGTSVGLFFTNQLDGQNTVWNQTGITTIENAVVMDLDYRRSDQVLAVGTHGRGMFVGKVKTSVSNEVEDLSQTPTTFQLEQNYPNPFNPSTNIRFSLPSSAIVNLTIFDINGREVAKVYSQKMINSGNNTVTFDASALASGTYVYRMEAFPLNGGAAFQQSKKMTLIK